VCVDWKIPAEIFMEKGLLEKTGKSLEQWVRIVRKENFAKHGEIIKFLKSEHEFTHGYANFVAHTARESDSRFQEDEELVSAQYSKGKEHFKPVYEKLRKEISQFGDDIEFIPKKANVSVKRKYQFVLIQPSTRTRMDLGLKLKGKEPGDRLEGSGPFGAMCTHRVQLTDISDIDSELMGWIKEAYEKAG
jgi:predicted transport protein